MITRALLLLPPVGADTDGAGPLADVERMSVVERALAALDQHGIHDVAVVGPGRERLNSVAHHGCRLLPPSAAGVGPAIAVPADLLFAPEMIALAAEADPPAGGAALLLDPRPQLLRDPDDALRARRMPGGRIAAVGRGPTAGEHAVVGVAALSAQLAARLARAGGGAWPELLASLLEEGAAVASREIFGLRWQPVTGAAAREHARWLVRAYGDQLAEAPDVPRAVGTGQAERTLACIEGLLSEKGGRRYVLMNPGPVLTSPRVKSALVHHDVCHRDDDYARVLHRVRHRLRRVCGGGAGHEVLVFSASGTAAMEATVASCVPADRKLLVVSNGYFGERFAAVARVHGIAVDHLRYEWAALVDPADVAARLDADATIAAVAMCHHETSVGILNPVHAVGEVCRARDRLFFVDAISSLGGEDVNVVRDGIDVLIGSANKCIHAISGLSFVCVAPRVWERIAHVPERTYYLDLRRYRENPIPFTPAVSNVFALDAALEEILRGGLARRWRRYRALNRRVRRALVGMGLEPLTSTGHESHTITTVAVPEGVRLDDLYRILKDDGYLIYGCKEHLEGRYFQVANMGELSDAMIDGFLATLERVLATLRVQAREMRVAASQAV